MPASGYLRRRIAIVTVIAIACAACQDKSASTDRVAPDPAELLPRERSAGSLDVQAMFDGPMPAGVTVSRNDRVLLSFPRLGASAELTLAELKDGRLVPFPSEELNRWPGRLPADQALVSVESVVVGPNNRVWVVDAGNPKLEGVIPGAAKLVAIDPVDGTVLERIPIPSSVALPTSHLSDVRIDLRRGKGGFAFITDASMKGPNAIIVVDLASRRSWRRLNDHPSTKADPSFVPFVEARELWVRRPGKPRERFSAGVDGVAISADGKRLYYCPVASRRLYSVSIDALVNEPLPDSEVAKTVEDLGEKGASSGLESDEQGRVYVASYEHNAILRRNPDGAFETLAHDTRLLWPDTIHLAQDGWLYFTVTQRNRQPQLNGGRDERIRPYALMRIRTDGRPVRLANVPVL